MGKGAPVAVGKGKGTPEPLPMDGKLGKSDGLGPLSLWFFPPKRASKKSLNDGAGLC